MAVYRLFDVLRLRAILQNNNNNIRNDDRPGIEPRVYACTPRTIRQQGIQHEEHIVGGASAEGIEFRPSPPHLIVNSILIACRNAKSSCRFN